MPHKVCNPLEEHIDTGEGFNRRDFMKTSALLGGSILFSGVCLPVMAQNRGELEAVNGPYIHHLPENQILSVCQQCNTN